MVWRAAPALARTDHQAPVKAGHATVAERVARYARQQALDWGAFVRMRVFLTALSISALYLTVLSFDGTMLAFLKAHACMCTLKARAHCAAGATVSSRACGARTVRMHESEHADLAVVAGLMGTVVMGPLERHIGLVRTGVWSIWCVAL